MKLSHQGQVGGRFTGQLSASRQLPEKFLAVVTGHELTATVARLRLIVKLSFKPRDIRNCLLSLTITPTVYLTSHIMDNSHITWLREFPVF